MFIHLTDAARRASRRRSTVRASLCPANWYFPRHCLSPTVTSLVYIITVLSIQSTAKIRISEGVPVEPRRDDVEQEPPGADQRGAGVQEAARSVGHGTPPHASTGSA